MDKYQMSTALIVRCEGYKSVAYYDSADIITIGVGTARTYPNGTPIKDSDTCNQAQAMEWLNYHLQKNVYPYLDNLCAGNSVADRTYAALTSFIYNEGSCGSSIVKAIQDEDLDELAAGFRMYTKIKVNGILVESPGLSNRREIEIAFFKGS